MIFSQNNKLTNRNRKEIILLLGNLSDVQLLHKINCYYPSPEYCLVEAEGENCLD